MSNVGLWDNWHGSLAKPSPYVLSPTYQMGADWLAECSLVEDWGCGPGWLSTLVESDRYRGIDGSASSVADEVVDLTEYCSEAPGIFVRHVLEHNLEWQKVLDNALASFTERMALILFTPLADKTHDLEWEDPPGVPNFSFRLEDLTDRFPAAGISWQIHSVPSAVKYGGPETIFRISR